MQHRRRIAAVGAALVMLATACGSDGGSDTSDPSDTTAGDRSTTTEVEVADRGNVNGTLELGFLAPQTGPMSAVVTSITKPVDLAVKEINDAGGVNGQDLVLVVRDDGADPAVAAASLDQLLESDKVDALLGPATSPTALATIAKIKSSGVVACSGSATSGDLTTADAAGFFFRTAPPDGFQGPALAELILADDIAKVAIIARNDTYGKGLATPLAEALADSGAEVAGDVVLYDPSASTVESEVSDLVDAQPEAVVVIGFSDDAATVVTEMIAQGIGPADLPIYTTDGFQNPGFGAMVDPEDPGVVAGIKGTTPAASPAGVDSPFMAAFSELGVPPIFSAYYYDCTLLTALAAQAAGSDDPAEIRDAFAANLEGDEDCATYAACLALLEDGKTIHYRGASSSFDTWTGTEPGSGTYDVWAFDETGEPVTEDPSSQITIG